jgi:hypothetical protein
MENKIILVGKLVTEHADEILEGYAQVEFEVDELLDEIDYSDVRKFAKDKLDLIPVDELSDVDQDDLVSELEDRDYNFIRSATDEAMINELEKSGYKCIYEYDKEYDDYLKVANLDIQDMNMLKEITKKFIDASIFERADMYQAVTSIGY